ncbi:MAG: hypothetical protein IT340_17640 [Chloroflexi bacterium]|nr:hypothetical protein [Chloroflexota bacterium]
MVGLGIRGLGRVALACLVSVPLLAVTPAPASAAATVTVDEMSQPGWYKVRMRGFFRTENLSTWLTGPSEQVFRTNDYETGDNGRADFRLFMLRHFQPGRWAITVVGQRSGREVITFFDYAGREANATVTMSATSLRLGDTVTVTGEGFRREERVSYWFTLPDGSAARGTAEVVAERDGVVRFTRTVTRPDLEPGGWALSLYGLDSDAYGVATFEIVEAPAP